jgi:uncharacterized repeat protein (TIGR03837 family)
MQWDLFCRVVDNYGDLGVCWRLGADLAGRGERVRLFVDDATALAWMAPAGAAGVEVCAWPQAEARMPHGDVVVEAFGCELPAGFVRGMVAAPRPPVWVNLEYLSAEDYVERSHRLPSPQTHGPGAGLTKWFFYPGFTAATGGLLREPDLMQEQAGSDAKAWLARHGVQQAGADERVVSLFCYANPALSELLDTLSRRPTVLLAAPGAAAQQLVALLGNRLHRGSLRAVLLPHLSQTGYDRLLWSCDLNLVRGEDSWVRAQWAGRPFLWQAYPQSDAVHARKVDAFLRRFLAGAPSELGASLRRSFARWNGLATGPLELPAAQAWQAQALAWRAALLAQADLTTQLIGFAAEKR